MIHYNIQHIEFIMFFNKEKHSVIFMNQEINMILSFKILSFFED